MAQQIARAELWLWCQISCWTAVADVSHLLCDDQATNAHRAQCGLWSASVALLGARRPVRTHDPRVSHRRSVALPLR
jgi:hypothetical protein